MLYKCSWLLCLATVVLSNQGMQKDQSFLRLYSKLHTPRTQWVYLPQDDHRHAGLSHNYASHQHGSTVKATDSSFDHSVYPTTSREQWRPSSTSTNYTSYYAYSRPYVGSTSAAGGLTYQDSVQGSHSLYQYQQMRPLSGSFSAFKKTPVYHVKGKLQVQSLDFSGKPKYKKTPVTGYKAVYPRVHKPYAKHKYPTVQSSYRRYYTSPYQRYSITPSEMLRYRVKTQSDGHYKSSTASPSTKHHTTERMDDTYPDGTASSEDYTTYNDTHHGNPVSYYDVEEETGNAASETDETSYDESTTRGYYGDRIYMSTQVPLVSSDKTAVKNKYYIIRRTHDDDIETLFE